LGLAIAKKTVDLLGGTITAESEVGACDDVHAADWGLRSSLGVIGSTQGLYSIRQDKVSPLG